MCVRHVDSQDRHSTHVTRCETDGYIRTVVCGSTRGGNVLCRQDIAFGIHPWEQSPWCLSVYTPAPWRMPSPGSMREDTISTCPARSSCSTSRSGRRYRKGGRNGSRSATAPGSDQGPPTPLSGGPTVHIIWTNSPPRDRASTSASPSEAPWASPTTPSST